MTSATAWTLAPSRVMRRAMISPMSPLPRITTFLPGHKALYIHQALGGSGGVDARRAVAGDVQCAPGAAPGSP